MNSNHLIQRCLAGDAEAERELFFRFAPKILTICRRYMGQHSEAKDLMQECFISLFEKLDKFDPQKGSLEGWIYRISTNKAINAKRKSSKSIAIIYPEVLPEVEETLSIDVLEGISSEQLLLALQGLPDGFRNVINMHVIENMKHEEIGKLLGISASTSRSQLSRAKKALREIILKETAKNISHEERLARG